MVLIAPPSASLAAELRRLLPDLRALVGGRRCTVVFDRGGYSPAVFAEITAAGLDLLTYYKGSWARSPQTAFTTVDFTDPDGHRHTYELAERTISLPVPAAPADGTAPARGASSVTLRLVVRRSPDGHQTPILTSRTDLTDAQVAWRMSRRWRQESGSPGALLRRGPLRTVRATFTAHGSSKPLGLAGVQKRGGVAGVVLPLTVRVGEAELTNARRAVGADGDLLAADRFPRRGQPPFPLARA